MALTSSAGTVCANTDGSHSALKRKIVINLFISLLISHTSQVWQYICGPYSNINYVCNTPQELDQPGMMVQDTKT
jgi:putative lipase involved disintegration of autophagic bodies